MHDPTSTLHAPPPRYLLESDSSDEEGQGSYPGGAGPSRERGRDAPPPPERLAPARVQGVTLGDEAGTGEIVVGVGQAGRYAVKKALGRAEAGAAGKVVLGRENEVVGRVYALKEKENGKGSWVVCVDEQERERAWAVVKGLSEVFGGQHRKWTVITTYLPTTYISSASEAAARNKRADPPVRAILPSGEELKGQEGLGEWVSPNYLTGVAGAISALAAHPAHPALASAALTTLLLPLPLSSLANSAFTSALAAASASALLEATRAATHAGEGAGTGASRGRTSVWDEADDEPYVAPGMGRREASKRQGKRADEDVGGMYM